MPWGQKFRTEIIKNLTETLEMVHIKKILGKNHSGSHFTHWQQSYSSIERFSELFHIPLHYEDMVDFISS